MKLTFLGAAHEVTGSCSLLQACGKKILIDCGMEQGADIYENCDIPVTVSEIDMVLLTHAHIDHSGKIPALVAALSLMFIALYPLTTNRMKVIQTDLQARRS